MSKILNEKLGVPSNLVNTTNLIYDDIYDIIPDNINFNEIDNFKGIIKGDFEISDLQINQVIFTMDININDNLELISMGTYDESELTKNYIIKNKKTDFFNLIFRFIGPLNTTGSEIKEYMRNNELKFIGSIAHELKHKYDSYKKNKLSLVSRVKYITSSDYGFGDVSSINRFLFFMYYTHIVESLVRPSELSAIIERKQLTKKDFYEFITSTITYKNLTELKNFNYDDFKNQIKNEISEIKKLFDMNGIDYINLSDDEIVEKTLHLLLINLRNWGSDTMKKFLFSNKTFFEQFMGLSGEDEIFYNNYIKFLMKFGNDYEKYFKNEIKLFNEVGEKMIRKIFKLYDLLNV